MEDYNFLYDTTCDLVSIVIPTRNRSSLLYDTLISIENQDYNKVEIIIVDDNSSDETEKMVANFSLKSRFNVRYFRSNGQGGCRARNIGLINCKGEFIQFFDDDDIVSKGFITERVMVLKNSDIDFCTCNFTRFRDTPGNIIGEKRINNINHDILSHLYYFSLPTPCFLFKRKCLEIIGYWNEDVKRLQDISYYHRLFKYKLKGYWMDRFLFSVRDHANNVTHSYDENSLIFAWISICREWRHLGKINKVRLLCLNRMWDVMATQRLNGFYFNYLLNMVRVFTYFPLLFIWFLLKVKLFRHRGIIYSGEGS